jgi:sulfhydrogenase subunit beta (sulfur reductase)
MECMAGRGGFTLERDAFDGLFGALRRRGWTVVGPTVRDDAIVYGEIASAADLPEGWTDEQDGGLYRLRRRDDAALFGYNVGPHSWKSFQLPPERRLWRARLRDDGELGGFEVPAEEAPRYAFLGARSCELHAMGILDRVLGGVGGLPRPDSTDPARRGADSPAGTPREEVFIVAVQCGQAGGTCFCASMGTGPTATAGFDIALTEVIEKERHFFVAETGSDRGAEVMAELEHVPAGPAEREAATEAHARAAAGMGRELDTAGIKELLYRNYENPRWDEVADRCLSCGNCTMVCPTCFCTSVEDTTDLAGDSVERTQKWDSCFTVDYSHIHGGAVHGTTKARYRQWMTHKLATWFDQFGSSGCVGCGRCITWCPVGIDITEEARAIRAGEAGANGTARGAQDDRGRGGPG